MNGVRKLYKKRNRGEMKWEVSLTANVCVCEVCSGREAHVCRVVRVDE